MGFKNHSLNYSDNKNKEEVILKTMQLFSENAPSDKVRTGISHPA
jgi:hypothetical protein